MTIPECPVCGTWVCAQCGWKRHGASLTWKHTCHRCGGTRGVLVPSRHRNESIRADHAAAQGASPAPPVKENQFTKVVAP